MSAASRTTAGSTLQTASNRRSPTARPVAEPLDPGQTAGGARGVAHDRPFAPHRGICGQGDLPGAAGRVAILREVGEHGRRPGRSCELAPTSLAPPVRPLPLEAADEHRPLGLGTALVLDGLAHGVHRPRRQHVHRAGWATGCAGRRRSTARSTRCCYGCGGSQPPTTCPRRGRERPFLICST